MPFPLFQPNYPTRDLGLLLMRLSVGFFMAHYGIGKLQGGEETWVELGKIMEPVGLGLPATFWGIAATYAELVGGALVFFGLFFGPAALLVAFTMVVATASHLMEGDTIMQANHSLELLFVYLGLALIGPGRYSIDALIAQRKKVN